jgi:hypothetical protein
MALNKLHTCENVEFWSNVCPDRRREMHSFKSAKKIPGVLCAVGCWRMNLSALCAGSAAFVLVVFSEMGLYTLRLLLKNHVFRGTNNF